MSTQTLGNVSYSNNVNFSAGDPQDFQFHDGTGVNPQWIQNKEDSNSFQWPPPQDFQWQHPDVIFPASTGISISQGPSDLVIDIAYEGQLRLNEETQEIEMFQDGQWKVIGHATQLPNIVPDQETDLKQEENDDFELGGAL